MSEVAQTPASETEQWSTVSEEAPTQIEFTNPGDQFIGTYAGRQNIDFIDEDGKEQSFTQDLFRVNGELYAVNSGYDLKDALSKVAAGEYVRVTYVKDVDTGRPSPMKSFRVEVRR